MHLCRVTSLWLRRMHCCVVNLHDGGSVLPGWVLPSALQSYSMALRLRKITTCIWRPIIHARDRYLHMQRVINSVGCYIGGWIRTCTTLVQGRLLGWRPGTLGK